MDAAGLASGSGPSYRQTHNMETAAPAPKDGWTRSVWPVLAGILTIVVATTGVNIVLHRRKAFPPIKEPLDDRLSLLALSYRIVISVAGAYLTSRLAPAAPMKHALILGAVGTVLGGVGVIATWGKGMGPEWYPISIAVLAVPQCWLGGKLYELRAARPGLKLWTARRG